MSQGDTFRAATLAVLGLATAVVVFRRAGDQDLPHLAGATVVFSSWTNNAAGIRVPFHVEELPGDAGAPPSFFGVIEEPWSAGNPVVVAQAATADNARIATQSVIKADTHGLPG